MKRIAVLASGLGTNLAHIHAEIMAGRVPSASIALVISNNSGSGALAYARDQRIASEHLSLFACGGDMVRLEQAFLELLTVHAIDLIVLAGYMKMLPEAVVNAYRDRVMNVHPALLPAFGGAAMYGKRVHEAVLARGCRVSGATVHFVTNEYDAGPIIMQKCCPVRDTDTVATLEHRVRTLEYEIYPQAIELVASGRTTVVDGRVHITPTLEAPGAPSTRV